MKKQVKLAIAAIVMLGSVHAMAEVDEFDIMNQQTKVDAVAAEASEHTRINANIRMQLMLINDDVNALIETLGNEGPESALQESGLGQLSFITQQNFEKAQDTDSDTELDQLLKSSREVESELVKIKARYNMR